MPWHELRWDGIHAGRYSCQLMSAASSSLRLWWGSVRHLPLSGGFPLNGLLLSLSLSSIVCREIVAIEHKQKDKHIQWHSLPWRTVTIDTYESSVRPYVNEVALHVITDFALCAWACACAVPRWVLCRSFCFPNRRADGLRWNRHRHYCDDQHTVLIRFAADCYHGS
jgi:hypothetical protein